MEMPRRRADDPNSTEKSPWRSAAPWKNQPALPALAGAVEPNSPTGSSAAPPLMPRAAKDTYDGGDYVRRAQEKQAMAASGSSWGGGEARAASPAEIGLGSTPSSSSRTGGGGSGGGGNGGGGTPRFAAARAMARAVFKVNTAARLLEPSKAGGAVRHGGGALSKGAEHVIRGPPVRYCKWIPAATSFSDSLLFILM